MRVTRRRRLHLRSSCRRCDGRKRRPGGPSQRRPARLSQRPPAGRRSRMRRADFITPVCQRPRQVPPHTRQIGRIIFRQVVYTLLVPAGPGGGRAGRGEQSLPCHQAGYGETGFPRLRTDGGALLTPWWARARGPSLSPRSGCRAPRARARGWHLEGVRHGPAQ